jgi:ATP-binding cassette subfamily F protein 3
MIILRNISLRRGAKVLLRDVDLTIQPGQHLALTGANGCGKTSLFALLMAELAEDNGHIDGIEGMRIAAMAQEVAPSEEPALDYLIGGNEPLALVRAQLAQAEAAEDYERSAGLHQQLDAAGGYDIEHRAERMLDGLGFAPGDGRRPLSSFSGGWRIRLSLGRALMASSDLLLLDEPTNHLDLDATLWLQQWLQDYRGTLILISHDREFIDATCDQVLHVEHQHVKAYRGNYSAFEKRRAEQLANQQATYEKQQRRVTEIDAFVRRFRYKATKAKQAQSRLKELERMQLVAPAHVDSPFSFQFPEPEKASDPILRLSGAKLGYGNAPVLRDVEMSLRPGTRIGLLGRNGAGKSTLLKSLVGSLPLMGGERTEGAHCKVGYFDQQQLEALDLDASAFTHLQRLRPDVREQEILDFLGGFNFRGEDASKAVAPFSGGEKTRLALAIVAWQRPNLLVMDEPTNHLDMNMRHALNLALQAYQGAVILVTHDRHLLRNTVDELLLVHDGSVEEFREDLHAYERWILREQRAEKKDQSSRQNSNPRNRREQRQAAARARERLRPLKKRIQQTERAMADAETRLSELESLLSDTGLYENSRKDELDKLLQDQGELRRQADAMEHTWLDLQQELESLEASQ